MRPEFEGIKGQLYNRENPLTFDEAVAQLLGEESRLLEMKGGETTAYTVTQPGNSATTQHGTNLPNTKKGQMTNKENLWCNYCKRKGHVKETCWKLQSRTPQAHIMMQSPQGDMPGVQQWTLGGQQWLQNCTNLSNGKQLPTHNLKFQPQMHPQPQIHSQPQGIKNLQLQIQNLQQQVQHLITNPVSSGSVSSLANSSKNSILSVLSSLSTPNLYKNS